MWCDRLVLLHDDIHGIVEFVYHMHELLTDNTNLNLHHEIHDAVNEIVIHYLEQQNRQTHSNMLVVRGVQRIQSVYCECKRVEHIQYPESPPAATTHRCGVVASAPPPEFVWGPSFLWFDR